MVELREKESRVAFRARPAGDGTHVFNDISQHYLRETVGTLQWNRSRSLYLGAFLVTAAGESFGTSSQGGVMASKTTRYALKS
ncbi:hypothetical protein WN51_12050 [Melipona quadrifasciata]|uniref:Uncharacterized protein n=1 Tax=Melipona quadrifasciata TaxID=166423 RepID=A0A0M9A4F3_9HYME|nr:hypothetical protein WN51_12050 [Melipona quadrifasciata]